MENSCNAPFQLKLQNPMSQFGKIMFHLAGGHQIYKDFFRRLSPTHKEMAQITLVTHLMIVTQLLFPTIFQNTAKNLCKIFMNNFAVVSSQNIIGAALFVKPKGKRPIFDRITKGELHFIPIPELQRTFLDSLKNIVRLFRRISLHLPAPDQSLFNQLPDLPGFHRQLVFIGHSLIHAAAAGRELTAHSLFCFHIRLFKHFQKPSFTAIFPFFIYLKPNPLPWHSVFHNNADRFLCRPIVDPHNTFIRKFDIFNNALKYFTFFHNFTYPFLLFIELGYSNFIKKGC